MVRGRGDDGDGKEDGAMLARAGAMDGVGFGFFCWSNLGCHLLYSWFFGILIIILLDRSSYL